MVFRFIKNLWEEIEDNDMESGFFAFLFCLGLFLTALGGGIESNALMIIGLIFLSFIILLLVFGAIKFLYDEIIEPAWKRTKKEEGK